MIDDPYKVLGVSSSASMDEVKKAYRKMAKLYHPDMHPNDPNASKKMNEINEAYDMIMNPDKYAKARAQQQQQQQQRQYYGGGYSSGGYSSGNYRQQGTGEDYGGFDFNDFFGGYQTTIPKPTVLSSDSPAVRQAIIAINNDSYANAVSILSGIVSAQRNARWYYLSAIANLGAGNRVAAWENIQKAANMEPNNSEYQNAMRIIGRDAQSYQSAGRGFNMDARGTVGLCAGLCVLQLCCRMSMCGC